MIRYDNETKTFLLNTENTCYAFTVAHDKYPVHLYYGDKANADLQYREAATNVAVVPNGEEVFSLDAVKLEFSGYGVGDFRTTSVKVSGENNNGDTCFTYRGYKIMDGVVAVDGLPYAKGGDGVQTLCITLHDQTLNCNLYLYYTVYPDCDVITRSAKIENLGASEVFVENCVSACLDLDGNNFDVITLSGCYAKEMHRNRAPIFNGGQKVCSRRGASSHNYNPFMAVCDKTADFDNGNAYAVNLMYSGDFVTEAETSYVSFADYETPLTRVQTGLNPENFAYKLKGKETFQTPQAVLTYTKNGLNGITKNFHTFIKKHVLPKPSHVNPIVLNTWEACFFDIDENKLLSFAKECADVGIDTLVVDDGWFGHRDKDNSSLGDWFTDVRKFPNGIGAFAEKVRENGVQFGLWIEPEMISPDSELFVKNPQWVLGNPNRALSLGRNQLILDMANPEVIDYLKDALGKIFRETNAHYIKWDMNRNFSEVGSRYLPLDRQKETAFRYMKGVYNLLQWMQDEFPQIILETCSGGGGRYDLGMMRYSSMIWASDNTYPKSRIQIQNGGLTAYPVNVLSAHISNPNGACEDVEELNYRYAVAVQGQLGFEMDISKVSAQTKTRIKALIADYKQIRGVITNGQFSVLLSPNDTEFSAFSYQTDKEIFVDVVRLGKADKKSVTIRLPNAKQGATYIERYSGKKVSGQTLQKGIRVKTGKTNDLTRYSTTFNNKIKIKRSGKSRSFFYNKISSF